MDFHEHGEGIGQMLENVARDDKALTLVHDCAEAVTIKVDGNVRFRKGLRVAQFRKERTVLLRFPPVDVADLHPGRHRIRMVARPEFDSFTDEASGEPATGSERIRGGRLSLIARQVDSRGTLRWSRTFRLAPCA